jgi:hypothetical protein
MERRVLVSQNMIFEFGYIVGKLGVRRVCALYEEGMKIPLGDSDIVCIPMDSRGRWRLLIAKEIKQAGIEIDLNKAISYRTSSRSLMKSEATWRLVKQQRDLPDCRQIDPGEIMERHSD